MSQNYLFWMNRDLLVQKTILASSCQIKHLGMTEPRELKQRREGERSLEDSMGRGLVSFPSPTTVIRCGSSTNAISSSTYNTCKRLKIATRRPLQVSDIL